MKARATIQRIWSKQRRSRWIYYCVAFQLVAAIVYFRSPSVDKNSSSLLDEEEEQNGSGRGTAGGISFNEWSSLKLPPIVTLPDDSRTYFQDIGSAKNCYVGGTDAEATQSSNSSECQCKLDFHGRECGIPSSAWFRSVKKHYSEWNLKPRKVPRRIIHGLNINHEINFLQVRLEELQDSVDAYIVCESNYTAMGTGKPLYLLEKLRNGFMQPFHSRMIYVPLLSFPKEGLNDGWFTDMYLRTYMGLHGLRRIQGIRHDDLFVLLDADEIPTREVLMFLKLYDGYPEPIRLGMRWSVFGFFWKRKKQNQGSILDWIIKTVKIEKNYEEDLLELTAVSTMRMVWEVCNNNTFLIRKDMSHSQPFQDRLEAYRQQGNHVSPWTIGKVGHYAGFHCSWCYDPEGIRTKLLSAHVDDKPRWGDYPEKTDLNYIQNLITKGEWFDGSHPFLLADWEKEEQYAPHYILEHADSYKNLLYPPFAMNNV